MQIKIHTILTTRMISKYLIYRYSNIKLLEQNLKQELKPQKIRIYLTTVEQLTQLTLKFQNCLLFRLYR